MYWIVSSFDAANAAEESVIRNARAMVRFFMGERPSGYQVNSNVTQDV